MSRQRSEDKAKKWIGGFIIAIMILSVLAFAASFVSNTGANTLDKYNGFRFAQSTTTGLWEVEINDYPFSFVNHPSQISYITIPSSVVGTLQSAAKVTITFSADHDQPQFVDFARFKLLEYFNTVGIPSSSATTNETEDYQLPIATCEDAAALTPVLLLEVGNFTELVQDQNCIYIRGDSEQGVLEASEAIIYKLLGVNP